MISRSLLAPARTLRALGVVAGASLFAHGAGAQARITREVRSLATTRVVAQVGTGVLLGPLGYVGGGLGTRYVARRLGASQGTASYLAEKAAYVGTAAATAAGPSLVGARGPGHGSYFGALGGATVGMFGSALVARLNRPAPDRPDPPCRLVCRVSAFAAFTLPAIGGTLGYNLTRRR